MWADSFDQQRFVRAVELATQFHGGQLRKGTNVPYLSHPMAVASLVAEDLGNEPEVLAALLHDVAEDQGGRATLGVIRAELGDAVADIVQDCSDSLLARGEEKAPWHDRKVAALNRLHSLAIGSLRVMAADKLHNTRATLADLQIVGPVVWERFKTGREGFIWYHEQMLDLLQEALPKSRSVRLLAIDLEALKARSKVQ